MYLIKNVGKYEVALGDLRITLRSNQKQDLDMICSRHIAEQSKSLKHAIKRGLIKIICKDMGDLPPSMQSIQQIPQIDPSDKIIEEMRDMRKEMIERQEAYARRQQALIENSKGEGGLGEDAQQQLAQAISALQALAGGQLPVTQTAVVDREFDLPDDKAVEVHKRTIDRLSKDSKGSIKHEETKSKSVADERLNELEDLLG